jgi:glycosyltransferase involved in cell wall biosynthesis
MDAPSASRGRIWLDVTTSRRAGAVHDGTTRIERGLIRELPPLLGERLGFCIYDRTMKRFLAVPQPALPEAGAVGAVRPTARRSAARTLGRRVERRVRGFVKGAAARTAAALDRVLERRLFPESRPGDVLLLAGENWSRYDFNMLRRLRADHSVRIAAVLQDMIPVVHPQFFDDAGFLARFGTYVDFLARDADLVFAISDATRSDFLRAAPDADPERIERIELGADIDTSGEHRRPAALADLGRPFVLSVSTIQARKNFDLLYRLWQRFARDGLSDQPHLVIAGRPGFGSADLLHLMRNDPAIADTVTLLHGASDSELAWLYANCLFTLYPSWYEGWGLPLSESLAHGRTFIASNTSSLPEAGQGLGIHLDPYDLMAWHREVLRLAGDSEARAAMERRIQAERKLSSWSDCARGIAEALNRFMN